MKRRGLTYLLARMVLGMNRKRGNLARQRDAAREYATDLEQAIREHMVRTREDGERVADRVLYARLIDSRQGAVYDPVLDEADHD